MATFNNNFYKSNRNYTREMAEARLVELGYSNFEFKASSFTNGASFYFTSEDNKTIRVSDHILTGSRAFETIQVSFEEMKTFKAEIKKESNVFVLTPEMIAAAKARKASRK